MTEPAVVVAGRLPELTTSLLPEVVRVRANTLADVAALDVPYSAIVIDLRDMLVDDVARWIATRRERTAPVLVVSPSGDELAIGADDVLAVPFSSAALTRRLLLAIELGRTRSSVEALARTLEAPRTFGATGTITFKEREAARRRFEHLAAMGTMVAGFAHEVRNPVAALRSIAEELGEELVAAGLLLPHAKRMLGILERMERLVRTSLQFGRPAAPRRSAHRPWTICSAALAGVSARTMATGHPIRVEFDPDLPDVFVDDAQLAQALVILLDNALDAAKSPRGVLLRALRGRSAESASVRFEIIDDGPGIAPADVAHIFDPFFTTKASGTGLGLSIAQQIVNENGARIEVSSMSGAPTCFAIIVSSPASVVSGESEPP